MKTVKFSATLLILAILLGFALPTEGQETKNEGRKHNRKEMSEKIKASKIAYLTQQVELTPEEAEKFWPVYNELEDKKMKLTEGIMERYRGKEGKTEEPTDEEAAEMMEQRFKMEQDLLDLKIEYHERFMQILPANKVGKLYRAEDHFKRDLMDKFRQRDGERRPEGKGVATPGRGKMMRR